MIDFEIILILATMVIAIACIVLAVFSKTFRKILCGMFVVAALIYGGFAARNAIAEKLPELFIIEQFEEVECENNCLKLTFNFHGELLSFYWEGPLDLTQQVWVTVWESIEVIDADYVKELP